jgi:hypothetical protein
MELVISHLTVLQQKANFDLPFDGTRAVIAQSV